MARWGRAGIGEEVVVEMRVGRSCSVCACPRRADIDRALLDGLSTYAISRQFAVSADAALRHAHSHLGAQLRRSEALREMTSALALTDQLLSLRERTEGVLNAAEQAGDAKLVLAGVETAGRLIERLFNLGTVTDLEVRIQRLEAGGGGTHDDAYRA